MSDLMHIYYLSDAAGRLQAVQLSPALWEKVKDLVEPFLPDSQLSQLPDAVQEPLESFSEFLQYWDFAYPYNPAVVCPHCGQAAEDWRAAPGHPFVLVNANLGGLLVFRCKNCQTTIRQKHFRDHVALEHSTPQCRP